jgi:hypothetical protein
MSDHNLKWFVLAAIFLAVPIAAAPYTLSQAACETVIVITGFAFEAKPPRSLSREFTQSMNAFARPISEVANACEGPRPIVIATDADLAALKEISGLLASKGIMLDPGGPFLQLDDRRAGPPAAN